MRRQKAKQTEIQTAKARAPRTAHAQHLPHRREIQENKRKRKRYSHGSPPGVRRICSFTWRTKYQDGQWRDRRAYPCLSCVLCPGMSDDLSPPSSFVPPPALFCLVPSPATTPAAWRQSRRAMGMGGIVFYLWEDIPLKRARLAQML